MHTNTLPFIHSNLRAVGVRRQDFCLISLGWIMTFDYQNLGSAFQE